MDNQAEFSDEYEKKSQKLSAWAILVVGGLLLLLGGLTVLPINFIKGAVVSTGESVSRLADADYARFAEREGSYIVKPIKSSNQYVIGNQPSSLYRQGEYLFTSTVIEAWNPDWHPVDEVATYYLYESPGMKVISAVSFQASAGSQIYIWRYDARHPLSVPNGVPYSLTCHTENFAYAYRGPDGNLEWECPVEGLG